MGTSIDNCRILIAASAIVHEAKLGDISDLPACIASTENLNDKTAAIGHCFVSSGFYMISGDSRLGEYPGIYQPDGEMFGGKWDFETDPTADGTKNDYPY